MSGFLFINNQSLKTIINMDQKIKTIRIAIQKNGRLMQPSLDFLASLGLKFAPNGSKLINPCLNADIELLYVRNRDIPKYIMSGVSDYAIVGENVLIERNCQSKVIKKLGFGKCSLVIAAPISDSGKFFVRSVSDLSYKRIATSYLNTLNRFLSNKGIEASVIEINGSVEICPSLDLADAVCDITQTGETLRANGLKIIEKVLDSEAVLVESPYLNKEKSEVFRNLLTK